jgi:serine/threonine protein kinase
VPNADVSGKPKIANVEILELIGTGGMSRVYKARQTSLERIVAIKVMAPELLNSESARKSFDAEIRLTSSLEHQNIVQVLGAGISEEDAPYLVLEFVEGISLATLIAEKAPLSYKEFRQIFLPLLSALQHAHEKGVLHRDIKPSNIIVVRDENGALTPKLLDFGIAKLYSTSAMLQQTFTAAAMEKGTPIYMSPEQCTGKDVDARSDLYSLACVMYESLSGASLFSAESAYEAMYGHLNKDSRSVLELCQQMEIPEKLAKILYAGLHKEKNQRPESAVDFSRQLSRALDEITLDKRPHKAGSQNAKSKNKRIYAILACIVFLISACLAPLLLGQYNGQTKRNADSLVEKENRSVGKIITEANRFTEQRKVKKALAKYNEAINILQKGGAKGTELARCYLEASYVISQDSLNNVNANLLLDYVERAERIYKQLGLHDQDGVIFERKINALKILGVKVKIEKMFDDQLKACKSDPERLAVATSATQMLCNVRSDEKASKLCQYALKLASKEENSSGTPYELLIVQDVLLYRAGEKAKAVNMAKSLATKLIKEDNLPPSERGMVFTKLSGILLNEDPRFLLSVLKYEVDHNRAWYRGKEMDESFAMQALSDTYLKLGMKEQAADMLLKLIERVKNAGLVSTSIRYSCLTKLANLEPDPSKKAEYLKQAHELQVE